MKGIILAGGGGTRLYPITHAISKQLLPVYDKPMIYYPLDVLLKAGINDILIISTKDDTPRFMQLLEGGDELGIHLEYRIQPSPNGLAEAFIIGERFVGDDDVCLILGDNIFFGSHLEESLKNIQSNSIIKDGGAVLYAHKVKDPERFGVVEFDSDFNALSIEEKPLKPKSNWAVTGLYFYSNTVLKKAKTLKPSKRGELEITDLNNLFLNEGKVSVVPLPESVSWLDAGTHESLLRAGVEVEKAERASGHKIACIEETCYKNGWIDKETLLKTASGMPNQYGDYLRNVSD